MAARPLTIAHKLALTTALTLGCVLAGPGLSPALAQRISHPSAVFAGLDKITGRIIAFEAAIDETVQFGSLQITPRVCFTRPATEAPLTTGFVEVDEVGEKNEFKRIFGGWMFAASPGLHAIEHPVYDAWLTDCKGGADVIPDEVASGGDSPGVPANVPLPPRREPALQQQALPPVQQQQAVGRRNDLGRPGEIGPPPGSGLRPPASLGRAQQQIPPDQRRAPSQRFFPTSPAPQQRGAPSGIY